MARKKQYECYPREYLILFQQAAIKRINVACDSPEQARSLRQDLYAFRSVLCDCAESDTQMRELAKLAHTVTLSLHDRTLTAEPIRGTVQ